MREITLTETQPASLAAAILRELHARANEDNVAGMARYGIESTSTLGVSVPVQRELARRAKKQLGARNVEGRHETARLLWDSGIHEARMTAGFIDAPELVSAEQMDRWAAEFDSWDVCDQVSTNLFDRTDIAWEKAAQYADQNETFVKRCGFVIMAGLAVHDKTADDQRFHPFLDLVEREARDERNFVKKAVNWALRQIGKRSRSLHAAALETCERILVEQSDSTAARWVARDALRELADPKTVARLKR